MGLLHNIAVTLGITSSVKPQIRYIPPAEDDPMSDTYKEAVRKPDGVIQMDEAARLVTKSEAQLTTMAQEAARSGWKDRGATQNTQTIEGGNTRA